MPERVTREERRISMAIQKARDAKEVLYHSLMDNNRSPMDDESEHVKLKRPKAENYTYKGESNDGPTTLHAYAGEITKAIIVLKQIKESDYDTNPFLDEEDREAILEGISELDSTITQLSKDYKSANKPEDMKAISNLMGRLVKKVNHLEKVFRRLPEPESNEESNEALDPDYGKFMRR